MSEARGRDGWQHTSSLLSMLFNVNRGNEKALSQSDFNPYETKADVKPLKIPFSVLMKAMEKKLQQQ